MTDTARIGLSLSVFLVLDCRSPSHHHCWRQTPPLHGSVVHHCFAGTGTADFHDTTLQGNTKCDVYIHRELAVRHFILSGGTTMFRGILETNVSGRVNASFARMSVSTRRPASSQAETSSLLATSTSVAPSCEKSCSFKVPFLLSRVLAEFQQVRVFCLVPIAELFLLPLSSPPAKSIQPCPTRAPVLQSVTLSSSWRVWLMDSSRRARLVEAKTETTFSLGSEFGSAVWPARLCSSIRDQTLTPSCKKRV